MHTMSTGGIHRHGDSIVWYQVASNAIVHAIDVLLLGCGMGSESEITEAISSDSVVSSKMMYGRGLMIHCSWMAHATHHGVNAVGQAIGIGRGLADIIFALIADRKANRFFLS